MLGDIDGNALGCVNFQGEARWFVRNGYGLLVNTIWPSMHFGVLQALTDLNGAEFHRAYEISEKFRVAVEIAREALKEHLAEHEC